MVTGIGGRGGECDGRMKRERGLERSEIELMLEKVDLSQCLVFMNFGFQ